MKRWMAIVVACVMMCLSCAALGEEIDFAQWSDAEIVALMGRIQEEIVARHIAGTAMLASGTYIAGRDIPAGAYVYTCLATGDDWGNVTVYSENEEGKRQQRLWEVVSAPDEGEEPDTLFITLEEGDEIKSGVPFSLTIYAGVIFQ